MSAAVDKRAVQSIKRAARKASIGKRLGKDVDPALLELLQLLKDKEEDEDDTATEEEE
jgi:hypothetical protein